MLVADIGDSVQRGADEIGNWVPNLLAALLILVVGFVVAKVVSSLVHRALRGAGADRRLAEGTGGSLLTRLSSSPSRLGGTIAFWAIMLGVVSLAVSALGLDALESFMGEVYAYLPNVLAAILIFVVASLLAAGIAGFARRVMGETGLGRLVATGAPVLVMVIATFMILDQLQIAETIVTITYAGLIGALALGAALAFGLGGRDVAREMLLGAYETGRAKKEQFRQDLDAGLARARAERAETRVDGEPTSRLVPEREVERPASRAR